MYSVVLLAALASGNDVIDCGRRRGGCGGRGGYSCGGYAGGGGYYGGRRGYRRGAYVGVYGGGYYGGRRGRVRSRRAARPARRAAAVRARRASAQPAPAGQPARIVVSLPADARLTIEGATTRSTSGRRVFLSPNLSPGKVYAYTLRAEVERDGQTVQWQESVQVRAGQESEVKMTVPAAAGLARR
jgi:uncharacterized protein (TIGR03000 family)